MKIVQSWDTANKATELSDYRRVHHLGASKDQRMYLIGRFSLTNALPWPEKAILTLAEQHEADVVLIEDTVSGSSLIQELRADYFSKVQEAPIKGEETRSLRLRAQTAKIQGGFALFPERAPWLDCTSWS